jgi:hypothetical protein
VMSPHPVWARSSLVPRTSERVKRKPRNRDTDGEAETRALMTETNSIHLVRVQGRPYSKETLG